MIETRQARLKSYWNGWPLTCPVISRNKHKCPCISFAITVAVTGLSWDPRSALAPVHLHSNHTYPNRGVRGKKKHKKKRLITRCEREIAFCLCTCVLCAPLPTPLPLLILVVTLLAMSRLCGCAYEGETRHAGFMFVCIHNNGSLLNTSSIVMIEV